MGHVQLLHKLDGSGEADSWYIQPDMVTGYQATTSSQHLVQWQLESCLLDEYDWGTGRCLTPHPLLPPGFRGSPISVNGSGAGSSRQAAEAAAFDALEALYRAAVDVNRAILAPSAAAVAAFVPLHLLQPPMLQLARRDKLKNVCKLAAVMRQGLTTSEKGASSTKKGVRQSKEGQQHQQQRQQQQQQQRSEDVAVAATLQQLLEPPPPPPPPRVPQQQEQPQCAVKGPTAALHQGGALPQQQQQHQNPLQQQRQQWQQQQQQNAIAVQQEVKNHVPSLQLQQKTRIKGSKKSKDEQRDGAYFGYSTDDGPAAAAAAAGGAAWQQTAGQAATTTLEAAEAQGQLQVRNPPAAEAAAAAGAGISGQWPPQASPLHQNDMVGELSNGQPAQQADAECDADAVPSQDQPGHTPETEQVELLAKRRRRRRHKQRTQPDCAAAKGGPSAPDNALQGVQLFAESAPDQQQHAAAAELDSSQGPSKPTLPKLKRQLQAGGLLQPSKRSKVSPPQQLQQQQQNWQLQKEARTGQHGKQQQQQQQGTGEKDGMVRRNKAAAGGAAATAVGTADGTAQAGVADMTGGSRGKRRKQRRILLAQASAVPPACPAEKDAAAGAPLASFAAGAAAGAYALSTSAAAAAAAVAVAASSQPEPQPAASELSPSEAAELKAQHKAARRAEKEARREDKPDKEGRKRARREKKASRRAEEEQRAAGTAQQHGDAAKH